MKSFSSDPKTVLVVEDNADDVAQLQVASRLLPSAIAFHYVHDGESAIAYLKGEGRFSDRHAHPLPDLILLDLWLPRIDGFQVLAWIRTHPVFKQMKVFVWTDSGQQEAIERATRAGADRFVPKTVAFVRGGLRGFVGGLEQAVCAESEAREVPQACARPALY